MRLLERFSFIAKFLGLAQVGDGPIAVEQGPTKRSVSAGKAENRDGSADQTTASGTDPASANGGSATAAVAGRVTRRWLTPDFLARLPKMSRRDIDALDFGCVQVSDSGVVQIYNRWESEFANVPQEAAIGRNFFRELAPCTNNRLIFGRFKDGVTAEELDVIVSYAFTYKMRPTLVDVHLYRDPDTRTNWVLVRRTEGAK
jgi:photoactive yellow protein